MPERPLLPAAFDPAYYRAINSDLSGLNDEQIERHFREYGIERGLQGSAAALRHGFIPHVRAELSVLEIGPFNTPALVGEHIRYLDAFNKMELIERAKGFGIDPTNIPEIDYVTPTSDFSTISQKFAAAFGSHSIEHQPDLVRHLQGVSSVLEAEGRYYIICPDKRFCFDHFLAETTPVDVLSAFVLKASVHQPRSFIAQRLYTAHNDPARHWSNDHELPRHKASPETLETLLDGVLGNGSYEDTHAWQFTPNSFFEVTSLLHKLRLCDLYPERVYHTPRNVFEFTAVLRKGDKGQSTTAAYVEPTTIDYQKVTGEPQGRPRHAVESSSGHSNQTQNFGHEIDWVSQENMRLKSELQRVYASRSWRITEPLRRILGSLK